MAKKAAKKAPKSGVNKSEEIRKLARELQSKGEKVRPVTIVKTLKSKGIVVAPPQVSMVLKSMGFKRRKRRAAGSDAPAAKKGKAADLSFKELQRVKKVVEEFGGAKKLIDAVSALVELQ